MMSENASTKRFRYGPYEGYESRSQRRLQKDLEVDEAGAEAICICAARSSNYSLIFAS